MKRKSLINNKLIQMLPMLLLIILGGVIQTLSQTTGTPSTTDSADNSRKTEAAVEQCTQRLDKSLDALEKCDAAKADIDAELVTNRDLLKKEAAYNDELLKAVALLTSSEKRSKSFFEKLRRQVGRVLMAATDPKTIASIVSVILILDRLKK